jgi:hypothetical protein
MLAGSVDRDDRGLTLLVRLDAVKAGYRSPGEQIIRTLRQTRMRLLGRTPSLSATGFRNSLIFGRDKGQLGGAITRRRPAFFGEGSLYEVRLRQISAR